MPEKPVSTNERVKKRHGPLRFRDKKLAEVHFSLPLHFRVSSVCYLFPLRNRRENLSLWKRHFCLAFKSGLVTYRNAFCIWANNIILSSAGNNWIGANTKLLNLFICILCIILSSFPKTWCLSTQYEVLHWELNCNSKRNSEPFHLHFHIHKYIKM